ncbi:putative RNA-binding protein Luc7-like 1 [Paramacrobiotus metropolitanus]|uniref:putative RNA-binding protein Luc7-like 1 n=1 Tax=Paramacrobiotus metropolitanus TaxID=2943436 RepID=UPI0024458C8F|nr:putative RNA-binding protein Luc7-like 1 [Paramacrobiotus metropolitanus]
MSAKDEMRAMLAQLMGSTEDNNAPKIRFSDSKVCRPFLLGCCPHDVLDSTRFDIGKCRRIHDFAAKADYEKDSADGRDWNFEADALSELRSFIRDVDRRIELSKKDLAETQEELSTEVEVKANLVHDVGEQIGKKLAEAERLGVEGNVEESLKLMTEVEKLKEEKKKAEMDYRNAMPASTYQQQKLRVCEICSAYLGIHDNDRRLADHFGGKLHLGFIKLRDKLVFLEKLVDAKAAKRRKEREENQARSSPDRNRDRDRDRRDRDRDRDRDRGDDRRKRRSRSRSRDRQRDSDRRSSKSSRRDSRERRSHSQAEKPTSP